MSTKKDKEDQEEINQAIQILGDTDYKIIGNTLEQIQSVGKQISKEHLKKMKKVIDEIY